MSAVVWSIPSPPSSWAVFQVGPLTVHTYALCILIRMIAAILISGRRLAVRGVPAGFAVDAAIWAVPFGLVGARFYHVFTHTGDYLHAGANLWLVLETRGSIRRAVLGSIHCARRRKIFRHERLRPRCFAEST